MAGREFQSPPSPSSSLLGDFTYSHVQFPVDFNSSNNDCFGSSWDLEDQTLHSQNLDQLGQQSQPYGSNTSWLECVQLDPSTTSSPRRDLQFGTINEVLLPRGDVLHHVSQSVITPPSSSTSTKPEETYTALLSRKLNPRKRKADMSDQNPWQQKFPCPIFSAQVEKGRPHTCNGKGGNTMSEVRRHLTRRSGGHPAHLQFLKRCKVCNRDIVDQTIFEKLHGTQCHNPLPLKKKDAAYEVYQALYELLLEPSVQEIESPALLEAQSQAQSQAFIENHHTIVPVDSLPTSPVPRLGDRPRVPGFSPLVGTSKIPDSYSKAYSMPWALPDSDSEGTRSPTRSANFLNIESILEHDSEDKRVGSPMGVDGPPSSVSQAIGGVSNPPDQPRIYQPHSSDCSKSGFLWHTCQSNPVLIREKMITSLSTSPSRYYPSPISPCPLSPTRGMTTDEQRLSIQDFLENQSQGYLSSLPKSLSAITLPLDIPDPCSIEDSDSVWTQAQSQCSLTSNFSQSNEGWTSAPDANTGPSEISHQSLSCDQCGKTFHGKYRKGNLGRHTRNIHSLGKSAKSLVCRICKQAYNRQDAKRKHEWKKHHLADAKPSERRM